MVGTKPETNMSGTTFFSGGKDVAPQKWASHTVNMIYKLTPPLQILLETIQ